MSHKCHAHGCTTPVPPRLFMCSAHWRGLRQKVKDAIWREYRPGQEEDKRPSFAYLSVSHFAIGELAFKSNDEGAAQIVAEYMKHAQAFRQQAIENSEGDPLLGLVPKGC